MENKEFKIGEELVVKGSWHSLEGKIVILKSLRLSFAIVNYGAGNYHMKLEHLHRPKSILELEQNLETVMQILVCFGLTGYKTQVKAYSHYVHIFARGHSSFDIYIYNEWDIKACHQEDYADSCELVVPYSMFEVLKNKGYYPIKNT